MSLSLVTGATGHLGANLVRLLVENGRHVRVLLRPTSPAAPLEGVGCERITGDVRDRDAVSRAVKGCATVFHLAAVNRMTAADPATIVVPAVEGTRNVLQACIDAGVERVVYTSSVATLGRRPTPTLPLTEANYAGPSAVPYVHAKTEAEHWVLDFHARTGFPVVIVNPSAVLGPHDHRLTPPMRMVNTVMRGWPLLVPPGGLNIVDSRDVARGHVLADQRGRSGERYLLTGTNVTYGELFRMILRLAGKRAFLCSLPRPVPFLAAAVVEGLAGALRRRSPVSRAMVREMLGMYSFCDADKAGRELGFSTRPLEGTLRDAIEWLRRSRTDT